MAFLGLDIGTSSTKALLIDEAGKVLGVASAATAVLTPPGKGGAWTEQDPLDWWRATREAVRGALAAAGLDGSQVRAIGLSGQMHGSVFLSRRAMDGALSGGGVHALRPALLWNDQRTADQLDTINATAGGSAKLVAMVGNAALTGFQLPKVLWVRQHEPRVFAEIAAVLLPKDYIRFCMSGELATDAGDACGTLLFDPSARRWNTGFMETLGLDPGWFAPVRESEEIAGVISPAAAEQLGLKAGTPIVAGSGDNQCGAVGAGVVEPGLVLAILGTSGVIYAHTQTPKPDVGAQPPGRTHSMCSPGKEWCVTGVMLSAAGSLDWLATKLFPGVALQTLLAEAWAVEAGCEGLTFLPYLQGERCPHPDPTARGAFVGLSLRHGRGQMTRAVIEGVTFGMAEIMGIVRSLDVPVRAVRVGGGGAKSREWRQLLADVFGLPVEVPTTEEGGAYGAALLAGVGAGEWSTVAQACRACIRATDRVEPSGGGSLWAERVGHFADLYRALKGRFTGV